MEESELQQLVERCRTGEELAWHELYNRLLRSPACRKFRSSLGESRWQEVFHDMFIALLGAIQDPNKFTWRNAGAFFAFAEMLMRHAIPKPDREIGVEDLESVQDHRGLAALSGYEQDSILPLVQILTAIQTELGEKQRAILEEDFRLYVTRPDLGDHERCSLAAAAASQDKTSANNNRNKGKSRLREILFRAGQARIASQRAFIGVEDANTSYE